MAKSFTDLVSLCGKCQTGKIIYHPKSNTIKWDCGCYEVQALNEYTHQVEVVDEEMCEGSSI